MCRTPKDEAGMDHGTETGRVSQVRCAWSAQAVVALVLITFSRGAAGASRGERRDTYAGPSPFIASDRGIHAAPRAMAQVVRRAAEGAVYGTLAV